MPAVTPNELQAILGRAADRSFNCISVEGHTSTNDTVLLLANGPGEPLAGAALQAFAEAVEEVCVELARAIVDDAEGGHAHHHAGGERGRPTMRRRG
jgi:glutamate N-acetyltransferase/amino-acid N-acetyltransferase